MTKTHWYIYNYIKEESQKNKWVKQADIQKYLLEAKELKISTRVIRKKINEMRSDQTIQKVILTDYNKGYRLMTEAEEMDYLSKRKISILKMLKLCYNDIQRYNLNNQMKIAFTDTERDIYESLMKSKEVQNEKK